MHQYWTDFSTIRGPAGYFCSVSTGKALQQYTFKRKVLLNHPGLPVVKMSWEKNSKKKPMLPINFCFMIYFDFYNKKNVFIFYWR